MKSTTHRLAGGAAGYAAAAALSPLSPTAAAAALAFGTFVAGELPDLDIAGSRISCGRTLRRAPLALRLPLLLLTLPALLLGIAMRTALRFAGGPLGEHRGLTHTLAALVGFALLIPPLYLLYATELLQLAAALAPAARAWCSSAAADLAAHALELQAVAAAVTPAGVASHLALDAMTPHGVPALAPVIARTYRLPITVRTGSLAELPLAAALLTVWIAAALHTLP